MMRRIFIAIAMIFCFGLFVFNAEIERLAVTPMKFPVPKGFPLPEYRFQNNPLTKEGFELGRKLFYDGRLSKDGNFPCASCHQQFASFSTYDHPLSHGFNDQFTTRNAPALINVAWMKELHWDGGINHIEVQPLSPMTASNEMAENIDSVLTKLRADNSYKKMFRAAYGDDKINSQRMLKALAQFVAMLISADSKYDKMKRGEASFSATEKSGYEIFQNKCSSCHREPLFTDDSYRNTGLPVNPKLNDFGRMIITGKSEDSLKFKVPSLRNVYLTAPYGHDGRFYSIGAVIDHYRNSVVDGPTTDSLLRKKIAINDDEKYDLLQFLRTLTDSTFIKDKRFAQPAN
ncbi:MAG: cytochrome-c peroxidase [Bacteroidetes bacterium]|nr:MAG: cytochrome-c peroxidase [Bacteroidota bacterium]